MITKNTALQSSMVITNPLSVYYQNTRSIKNRTTAAYNYIASSNSDIIAITETWLDCSILDAEITNSDIYNLYRVDRNFTATGLTRGGGVLAAINNKINSSLVPLNLNDIELTPLIDLLCVKVNLHHSNMFIFVIYISPDVTVTEYEKLFDYLSFLPFIQNKDILMLGDFNITKYASFLADNHSDGKIFALNNFLNLLNLQQYNYIFNKHNKLLDLVLCNKKCRVEKSDDVLIREDDHHPALNVTLEMKDCFVSRTIFPKNSDVTYNFRKANFQILYHALLDVDWSFLTSFSDVESACQAFYDKLYQLFDLIVPKYTSKYRKRAYPPWFNGTIIRNIRLKARYWRRYKIHNDVEARNDFKLLRNVIKTDIDIAYSNYINNTESNITREPHKFWAFVNSKRKHASIPTHMHHNDQNLDNPLDIVNTFADFFSRSFLPPSDEPLPDLNAVFSNFNINVNHLSERDVQNALKKLKPKLTTGPDGVPSFLIRDCAPILAYPLTILFTLCIRNSSIPTIWKYSKVCPVFKKGDNADISNYRPIAILCNFLKAFEILIHDAIYPSVNMQISVHQHGFMKGRSTTSNLICITQNIAESLDQGKQMDVVYTDFTKAFDRLDHTILIDKLATFGFSINLIRLLKSYLLGRKQYVAYNGFRSLDYNATSGVPQGSILGPLLFNIFINDIVTELSVNYLLYADDLKLFTAITSVDDCALLQNDLSILHGWCTRNKLSLNVSKCNVMSYSTKLSLINYNYMVDGSILDRPSSFRDLGIHFDKELSFVHHITKVVIDSLRTLGLLIRTGRDFSDTNTLKVLYFAFIRSKLEYGSIVWNPHYQCHTDSLEMVQRKFVKFLWYKSDSVYPPIGFSQKNLLARFDMTALDERRECCSQIYLYKLIHNTVDCQDLLNRLNFNVPRLCSRTPKTFYLSIPHTNILKYSPLFSMCNTYNNNCSKFDIFNCTLSFIKHCYD